MYLCFLIYSYSLAYLLVCIVLGTTESPTKGELQFVTISLALPHIQLKGYLTEKYAMLTEIKLPRDHIQKRRNNKIRISLFNIPENLSEMVSINAEC